MTQRDTRDSIITRLFDAPRELVWKAWTEPERVMHWWGPIGFTSPVSRIDLRVGGKYHSCMRSPDGKTKLTLRHTGMPPGPDSEGAEQGWNESFDKLAKYLETENSIISGKNVPRFELPDLIPQWWGPKRFTTKVEKMDVNPGGVWRFIQHDQDGNEYAFNGVYREIVPPEREVHTFEFEGMPGHVILETSTFKEFEGKTKLTVTDLFQSVEDRDGMFKSGMKEGATESMDRLEEIVLKTLKMQ
jgi:uncharacterized protein YndB with AHSA1/START domain